jgi:hypothetical protein
MSTKFQVGTAALAIATAATITPAVSHAAPSLVSFAEGIGNSVSGTVDSVVVPTASASATTSCTPGAIGCYLVEGAIAGTQAWVRGATIYIGTALYVIVEGTGLVLKAFGLTQLSDGVLGFANNIAEAFKVGPYLTGA